MLSLKMTGEIGPRAFDQAPEPARRLPTDPCRFAEREADRLDQDQRSALLGPKRGKLGQNIGVLDARLPGRRYRRAACIFAIVVAAQASDEPGREIGAEAAGINGDASPRQRDLGSGN